LTLIIFNYYSISIFLHQKLGHSHILIMVFSLGSHNDKNLKKKWKGALVIALSAQMFFHKCCKFP